MSGRYSDDYDSYEDDFDDDSPEKQSTTRRSSRRGSRMSGRIRSTSRSPSPKYRSRSKKVSSRRDSFASYRSAYGTNRGPAKNKNKKSHSASSKMTAKTVSSESSMMRRVLSANRNKVSRLHNVLEELHQEMEELKDENKSLKRVGHRQERQIKKIDEEEASLPMLLQRHSAEMRTLKERLRRNQETLHKKEKESRNRDHEIQKLRDKVSSYRELSQDKKLEERAALAKKLEKLQNNVAEKDKKIADLEKSLTLKDKARQREMKDQKERYRQAKEELKRVQEDFRSLRDRLKEKERELDEKNIYHYHITQHKKKGTTFPALPEATAASPPPAITAPAPAITAPATHVEKSAGPNEEKRTNVFLTNAPSDSGSVVTDEGKDVVVKSGTSGVQQGQPEVPLSVRHDRTDNEDRLRREAEERRRREEDERRRRIEEDEGRKRRQEKEERRRREEEHERRKREEEEELKKQQEEQERARRQREEEGEKKRLEEEAEIRRKKDLLLARMRAIDTGSDKPNGVIQSIGNVTPPAAEEKPKKLPIFLQSDKPAKTETQPAKPTANVAASDDDVLSDISGGKKKGSAGSKQSRYSYDFKQTVENLHHGLPAHKSQEPDAKDSLSDDLNFGSYKPTLGRRAAAKRDAKDKDDLSFGSYNPSFGAKKETNRRNSGLDFGSGRENIPEKEQNGVIFGDYDPSFGATSKKTSSGQPNGNIISGRTSPAQGRRARGFAGKGASLFGEDLFTNEEVKPTGNPLFGDSSAYSKDKSSYPWENKVTVTKKSSQPHTEEDSSLPRRKHMQSFGKNAEKSVRAVDNALDDVDDGIEEVIL